MLGNVIQFNFGHVTMWTNSMVLFVNFVEFGVEFRSENTIVAQVCKRLMEATQTSK